VQRVEIPELRRRLHLRRDVTALEPVDLVQGDHDRDAELEHAPRDEAVARADPLARGQDEEDALDVLECRVDRALHVLRQRVERPLEAGQVGEHQLVVVAVRDPEDTLARRLRLVGHDRDLAAAQRIHERRLPDVRPAGDGDEAGLQAGRSHVSGSSSAAEYVTSSPCELRKVISGILNSYSHCRQPPQGDAVIPIAAMSPGL
jgi:hypothetical protein